MNHNSSRFVSDSIDNDITITHYEFDNLIYHADEDCEEYCVLPEELARLLQQESRIIEPY